MPLPSIEPSDQRSRSRPLTGHGVSVPVDVEAVNNGGPTKTMSLPSGSPAVDAGNPSGCTDGNGHLLKTDQRGKPRPDREDERGCDMGA